MSIIKPHFYCSEKPLVSGNRRTHHKVYYKYERVTKLRAKMKLISDTQPNFTARDCQNTLYVYEPTPTYILHEIVYLCSAKIRKSRYGVLHLTAIAEKGQRVYNEWDFSFRGLCSRFSAPWIWENCAPDGQIRKKSFRLRIWFFNLSLVLFLWNNFSVMSTISKI